MTYLVVALEAVVVLALLYALLVGQPAAQASTLQRIDAQSTENAWLRASLARPTPTPWRFR